jgi:hypothetical protein
MDTASLPQLSLQEKDTGAIIPGLEGVFPLYVSLPYLTIGNRKMPGQAINIEGRQIESGAWELVATVSWTVVAVHLIAYFLGPGVDAVIFHNNCLNQLAGTSLLEDILFLQSSR